MRFTPPGWRAASAGLALGALACWAAPAALAALGGTADSVSTDTQALRGQLRSIPYLQYDVKEIDTGPITVREYVTRSGLVFAITWSGPVPPDLRALLGTYFGRFESAAAAAHRASPGIRRELQINQSDLVVQSSGRLRSFHGIAYLPSLLPDGVSVSQLR